MRRRPRRSSTCYSITLVRPPQYRRRNRQPERLGGLQIDDELELGGLFDGKISGLGAFQNPVNVEGSTPYDTGEVHPVSHEAARLRVFPEAMHRRQAVLRRQMGEALSGKPQPRVPENGGRLR